MFGRLAIVFFICSFILAVLTPIFGIYMGLTALILFLLAVICAIYNQWCEIDDSNFEDGNDYIAPEKGGV